MLSKNQTTLIFVLTLVLILTGCGILKADEVEVTAPKYFEFNSEKEMIIDYKAEKAIEELGKEVALNVVIPSEIDGVRVKKIYTSAFYNDNLKKIKLPNTITIIYKNAFGSNQLAKINFPSGIKFIGHGAFGGNELKKIKLSRKIETIELGVFIKNKLKEVKIPNNVKKIELRAFKDNKLTEVKIPGSVKIIGTEAFMNNQLKKVVIKKGVKEIWDDAFAENNLKKVIMPQNVQLGNFKGDAPFSKDGKFKKVYEANNKAAGTYIKKDGKWKKQK